MRVSRKDKYPDTATFHFYNANPHNRITGDCVLRATCTGLNIAYNDCMDELVAMSKKNGYSICSKENVGKLLAEKGIDMKKQPRKPDNTKYTGKEFCKKIAQKDKRYIASIGGNHMVAIVGKKVQDIWDSSDGCIGNYWEIGEQNHR